MSGLAVFTHLKSSQVSRCLGRLLCFVGSKNSKSFIHIILYLVIVLLLSVPQARAEGTSKIELTPEEQAWLKAHPEIKLGIGAGWTPLVIPQQQGRAKGYEVDLLDKINALTSANIELVPGKWSELVEQAKEKTIDSLAASAISKEREHFFNFSESYFTNYFTLAVSPTNNVLIRNPSEIVGKKSHSYLQI